MKNILEFIRRFFVEVYETIVGYTLGANLDDVWKYEVRIGYAAIAIGMFMAVYYVYFGVIAWEWSYVR